MSPFPTLSVLMQHTKKKNLILFGGHLFAFPTYCIVYTFLRGGGAIISKMLLSLPPPSPPPPLCTSPSPPSQPLALEEPPLPPHPRVYPSKSRGEMGKRKERINLVLCYDWAATYKRKRQPDQYTAPEGRRCGSVTGRSGRTEPRTHLRRVARCATRRC